MFKFVRFISINFLIAIVAFSCISTIELVGKARPPINANLVNVTEIEPSNSEFVGNISVTAGSNWRGEAAFNEVIAPAKNKAASVGANIVYIENKQQILDKCTGYNSFTKSAPMITYKAKAYYSEIAVK